jgi:hypothetical protein
VEPDAAQSFRWANEADDEYIIVRGSFEIDPTISQSFETDDSMRDGIDFSARFVGLQLGRSGFRTPFEADISVSVDCLGAWCGGLGTSERIYFIEVREDSYGLDVGPCGTDLAPTEDITRILRRCVVGGACSLGD